MINAKLLQLVVNASNDGIVVAEQEGDDNILIYVNPAFEALTGLFWNELSITPVLNEADQLTYFIGIQKDVTAQVEAEQKASGLEEELRQLRAATQ